MGRWFNKIQSQTKPPKPPKPPGPSFGGFGGSNYINTAKKISQNTDSKQLIEFVQKSCLGEPVNPQQVIDELISIEDEQKILDGRVVVEELAYYIRLWTSSGMAKISNK